MADSGLVLLPLDLATEALLALDEVGTLAAGKVADLVIIDGDPLADISDLACVAFVIRDGRVVVDNR